jgi:hypothetical protein
MNIWRTVYYPSSDYCSTLSIFLCHVLVSLACLTLIGPGDVKVDLADFGCKLQEILISSFLNNLFLQKHIQIFCYFILNIKK